MSKGSIKEDKNLEERLKSYPLLKARIEELIEVVENNRDDIEKADIAEQRVLEEVRKIGREAMLSWSASQSKKKTEEIKKRKELRKHKKKD